MMSLLSSNLCLVSISHWLPKLILDGEFVPSLSITSAWVQFSPTGDEPTVPPPSSVGTFVMIVEGWDWGHGCRGGHGFVGEYGSFGGLQLIKDIIVKGTIIFLWSGRKGLGSQHGHG